MGTSDWGDDQWGRSRSPRERRGGNDDPDYRGSRGASSSRGERRGRPDGSSTRYRDERPSRGTADNWDRQRSPARDDWRATDEGRRSRKGDDGYADDGRDYVRGRSASRNGDMDAPTRSPNRRRPEWDDGDSRADRDRYDRRPPERSPRGQRPIPREDDWDTSGRGRRVPAGAPNVRGRPAPQGGLWDDDPSARRRPDVRGRQPGVEGSDPRVLRRGLLTETSHEPAVPEKGGMSFGRALLIIIVMFLIGSGLAFGYFKLTSPKANAGGTVTPATTAPVSETQAPATKPPAGTATPRAATPGLLRTIA